MTMQGMKVNRSESKCAPNNRPYLRFMKFYGYQKFFVTRDSGVFMHEIFSWTHQSLNEGRECSLFHVSAEKSVLKVICKI